MKKEEQSVSSRVTTESQLHVKDNTKVNGGVHNKEKPRAKKGITGGNKHTGIYRQILTKTNLLHGKENIKVNNGSHNKEDPVTEKETVDYIKDIGGKTNLSSNVDVMINRGSKAEDKLEEDVNETIEDPNDKMAPQSIPNEIQPVKLTKIFIAAVVLANTKAFLCGWQISILPEALLKEFINSTFSARHGGYVFDENSVDEYFNIISGIYIASGFLGALLSAKVANTYGRRKCMIYIAPIMVLSAILGALSKVAESPEMLVLSRLVAGLHTGLSLPANNMYISEISPTRIRGAAGVCFQWSITLGIFVVSGFKFAEIFGSKDLWPLLFACNVVTSFISLGLLACPDSPRFLYLQKNDESAARKSLAKLLGREDVDAEIIEMKNEAKVTDGEKTYSLCSLLRNKELRRSLSIACCLQIFQQLSGVNAVFNYSGRIFRYIQLDEGVLRFMDLFISFINSLVTIPAIPLVEKIGRRTFIIGSIVMATFSFVVMSFSLSFMDGRWEEDEEGRNLYGPICIVSIFFYIVGFALGLGPVPWILGCEVFRQKSRASGMALSSASNWLCRFCVHILFPLMNDDSALGPFVLLPFIINLVACFTYIVIAVPETKNRSYDDIASELSQAFD